MCLLWFAIQGIKFSYDINFLVKYSHDTKIMMNSIKARPKFSRMETKLNRMVTNIVKLQVFL